MPSSSRLPILTVRGFLIGVILYSGAALGQTSKPKSKAPESLPAAEQAAPIKPVPSPSLPQKPVAPEQAKGLCDNPQTPDERDLCQQWRMAEAAKNQAKWTERQFWITTAEVLGLFAVVFLTLLTARAANRSAEAAQKSVDVADRTFVASQRPWISANIEIASSLEFKDGEGRITIQFVLKNYGPSPAINVEVEHDIVPMMHMAGDKMVEITDKARKRKPRRLLGHKIFPNEEFTYNISMPISRTAIEAAAAETGIPDLKKAVFPVLVGCVVYNSTLNDENHTTEFQVHFGKSDPSNPNIMLGIETDDGEIPMDQLKITLSFGSGQAD